MIYTEEEGFADQTLVVQYHFGPTVDVSTIFDPDLYEPTATIDDVGDEAFVSDGGLGNSYHFIDGDVAGRLLYIDLRLEGDDGPSDDDVEQLFRTFHERVT